MKPENLKTKIFLDSGNYEETQEILDTIGFLDGQTTNPTYFAKSPHIQKRLEEKGKFTIDEVYEAYKETIQKISKLIPAGSVSIEVYADKNTTAEEMIKQAKEMYSWIPNAHIKLPIIPAGLKAGEALSKEGMRLNFTLCFSQQQAAAVYAATTGAKKGDIFVSPFVGRHHDQGVNGVDFIKNILEMYKQGDGHVEVLTASLRGLDQFYATISLGTDIITAGGKFLHLWAEDGLKVPDANFKYSHDKKPMPYEAVLLEENYQDYNIEHPLGEVALESFVADWNNLIK